MPVDSVTTIEQLLALPDDGLRHELLDGVHVVTPSPALGHQDALGRLYLAFGNAIARRPGFKVMFSPADVRLGPRTLVQPDLFVLRIDPSSPPRGWSDIGVPVLVVEVLSPGTASRDRGTKRRIYQQAGVEEYWIVDLDARLIERWMPGDSRPEIITEIICWPASGEPVVELTLIHLLPFAQPEVS
jgi:Uma2 family endonuclease